MASRPNIIVVETDSQDGRLLGCLGHPAMGRATPRTDTFAADGTLFRRTYSNNPICCPSRASMFSGQYTHHCEGWNNYKGLEPGTPTFLTRLAEAGYRTATFGKTDYLSGHHTIRARVTPWTRSASIMRPAYRMPGPRVIEDQRERVHEGDWHNVDLASRWLAAAAGESDRPFMLYLGLGQPHPAFTSSRRYLDRIAPEAMGVPAVDPSDHPVLRYQRLHKNWMHGIDDVTVLTVRHLYAAMIAEVDAMFGSLLDAVDALGLRDNTVIVFTSDHGELAMEHQQFYKMSPYEGSSRVPLIVAGPDVRQGVQTDRLASLIDLYPTLMEIAGATPDHAIDGHSLWSEVCGGASSRPPRVLMEFHDTSVNTGCFMLVEDRWKYVVYAGEAPQLFDLATDPDELHDLVPSHPEQVAAMDRQLRTIVDYEAVDAKVKSYDRASFGDWRERTLGEGTYRDLMARVYSGWDNLRPEDVQPWRDEDETRIEAWLSNRST